MSGEEPFVEAPQIAYPMTDVQELTRAFAPESLLTIRGSQVPVSEALSLIPAYYFPITSAADLVSKLADLASTGTGEDLEAWARRVAPDTALNPGGWS